MRKISKACVNPDVPWGNCMKERIAFRERALSVERGPGGWGINGSAIFRFSVFLEQRDIGKARGSQNVASWQIRNGTANLPYAVRYFATGKVGPGTVNSTMEFP
jgi:hypothetical protein